MTVADNRGRVHGRLGRWKFEREGSERIARESERVGESEEAVDEMLGGIGSLKPRGLAGCVCWYPYRPRLSRAAPCTSASARQINAHSFLRSRPAEAGICIRTHNARRDPGTRGTGKRSYLGRESDGKMRRLLADPANSAEKLRERRQPFMGFTRSHFIQALLVWARRLTFERVAGFDLQCVNGRADKSAR